MSGPAVQTVVIKVGSNSLTLPDGFLDRNAVFRVAHLTGALHRHGINVALVSSGAVAAGRGVLRRFAVEQSTRSACAAAGQNHLMSEYARAFAEVGVVCGQVLLTDNDFRGLRAYQVLQTSLMEIVRRSGLLPVINANDAVAHRIDENDKLAARLAVALEADLLIILTDVAGVYTRNPTKHTDAELVSRMSSDSVHQQISSLRASGEETAKPGSTVSSGGIHSKLEAARIAGNSGIDTVICSFEEDDVLNRAVSGGRIGTRVIAARLPLAAVDQYIGSVAEERGKIKIDEGAEVALRKRSSLVSVGINSVRGTFESGDVISVWSKDWSYELGRGVVNVSAATLDLIKGRSAEWILRLLQLIEASVDPLDTDPRTSGGELQDNGTSLLDELGRRQRNTVRSLTSDGRKKLVDECRELLIGATVSGPGDPPPRLLPVIDRKRFVRL